MWYEKNNFFVLLLASLIACDKDITLIIILVYHLLGWYSGCSNVSALR